MKNRQFEPGDYIEITADNTLHGLPIGSKHYVKYRDDEDSFEVEINNNGYIYTLIINDDDAIIATDSTNVKHDDTADINAEIQAALDPNGYSNLTAFNRATSFIGGGFIQSGKA